VIYANRPRCCKSWSCRWLADPLTAGMPRPDRCHYVIDLGYDYITIAQHDGTKQKVPALQVWVDPAFPHAHRASELRAYMLMMANKWGVVTIVRFDSWKSVVVIPPPSVSDGQWHEIWDAVRVEEDDPVREPSSAEPVATSEIVFTISEERA
jgi:hypothetical protein